MKEITVTATTVALARIAGHDLPGRELWEVYQMNFGHGMEVVNKAFLSTERLNEVIEAEKGFREAQEEA